MSDEPKSAETRDDDRKPPTWRGAGGQPVTVCSTPASAASGPSLTLLFDDLVVSLQNGDELTAVRYAAAAAHASVEAPAQQVRIAHDLRGYVAKDADARITVIAELGGAVQTFEYPYGTAVDEEIFRSWESATELRPRQRYLMTFTLSVERRTATALAHVGLSSVDMTIAPPAPTPPPGTTPGGSGGSGD